MSKPDCYKCRYRGDLPGSAHSRCQHPDNGETLADPFGQIMAIFASVGRVSPINTTNQLGVTGSPLGVRRGWFNWPHNFDPVWLLTCNGFNPKGGEYETTTNVRDAGSAQSGLQRNERDEIDERPIT